MGRYWSNRLHGGGILARQFLKRKDKIVLAEWKILSCKVSNLQVHKTERKKDSMIAATRRKWFALALLLGVQFMVVLDIAIVNVALPSSKSTSGSRRRTCSGS